MREENGPEFPQLIKRLVDSICEGEGLTRPELAADLDLNPSSVSTAAYRGEIGFPLVERLCERAGATDQEIVDLELAWLRIRASRPRDEALRRSRSIIRALTEEITTFEEWLRKKDLLGEYKKARRGDPLVKRVRRQRRAEDS